MDDHHGCNVQITELQETIEYLKEEYINLLTEYLNSIVLASHINKSELFKIWNNKIKDI